MGRASPPGHCHTPTGSASTSHARNRSHAHRNARQPRNCDRYRQDRARFPRLRTGEARRDPHLPFHRPRLDAPATHRRRNHHGDRRSALSRCDRRSRARDPCRPRHPERDEHTRRRRRGHHRRHHRHRDNHGHVSLMATRHLYVARHGAADAFGELTTTGYQQATLLGERLATMPVDAVWHSPLPRAVASAHEIAQQLPDVPLIEAPELIDHVPYVPPAAETPSAWAGFFDGYDDTEAAAGQRVAENLLARFGKIPEATTSWSP